MTPIARPRDDQRHEEARRTPSRARLVLVDLGVVEHRVDALAPPPLEHAAALRAGAAEAVPSS